MLTPVIVTGLVDHVTEFVTSTCLPSAVAVATNCSLLPNGMLVFPSDVVTLMAVIPPITTVIVAVPLWVPEAAVIMELPCERPVTRPDLLTDATPGVALLQLTPLLREDVLPSLYVPTALIWTVLLVWMVAVGPTVTDVNTGSTKKPWQPTPIAANSRVANADKISIFFLPLNMFNQPQPISFYLPAPLGKL